MFLHMQKGDSEGGRSGRSQGLVETPVTVTGGLTGGDQMGWPLVGLYLGTGGPGRPCPHGRRRGGDKEAGPGGRGAAGSGKFHGERSEVGQVKSVWPKFTSAGVRCIASRFPRLLRILF